MKFNYQLLLITIFAFGASSVTTYSAEVSDQEVPQMVPAVGRTLSQKKSQWASLKKSKTPVFVGQYKIASDPSIIEMGGKLYMYHTALDVKKLRTFIALSVSEDGFHWEYIHKKKPFHGMVLEGISGTEQENLESCYVIKGKNGEVLLYYSAYPDKGIPMKGFPAKMYLAVSKDGINFKRYKKPILAPTKAMYDNDACYSPTIIPYKGGFAMLYVGHNYSNTTKIKHPGVYLLGATSKNGYIWKKNKKPIVEPWSSKIPWMVGGAAEPAILLGPDKKYYLLFTGLKDEERVIGAAVADTPFGPYKFNPVPVITSTNNEHDGRKVLAPWAMIQKNKLRVWYLAENKKEHISVGYAEANWPLFSIE